LLDGPRLELWRLLDRPRLLYGPGLELPGLVDRPGRFDGPRLELWRLLDRSRLLHGASLELPRLLLELSGLLDGPRLGCGPHFLRLAPALLGVLHPILVVAHLLLRPIIAE
jgi:hypothetical protein